MCRLTPTGSTAPSGLTRPCQLRRESIPSCEPMQHWRKLYDNVSLWAALTDAVTPGGVQHVAQFTCAPVASPGVETFGVLTDSRQQALIYVCEICGMTFIQYLVHCDYGNIMKSCFSPGKTSLNSKWTHQPNMVHVSIPDLVFCNFHIKHREFSLLRDVRP